jgi:hypothetical protein
MIGSLIRPNIVRYVRPQEIYTDDFGIDRPLLQDLNRRFPVLVLELSRENYGIGNFYIYDECEKLGLNFVLLTHDVNAHGQRPHMMYYPHWYYYCVKHFRYGQEKFPKQYLLSCINRNPKRHRILNYFLLKKKSYWNQSLVTLYQPTTGLPTRFDDFDLPAEIELEWQNNMNLLPQWRIGNNATDNLTIDAFTNSYVHLVTESTCVENFFVTEKTWKPIASEQLFFVYGAPGMIKYLREVGVDTFDDIIDHKYYDTESDPVQRLHRLHTVLDDFLQQDVEQIYVDTAERREKNKNLFVTDQFNNRYYSDLKNTIDKCINSPN